MAKAKKTKVSPDKKNKQAIKSTLILFLFFVLGAGVFLFFNQQKDQKSVSSKNKPAARSLKTAIVPQKSTKAKAKPTSSKTVGKIAFVIDDWGYRRGNCRFLKEIKAPLAIAILPDLPYTNHIMKCASVYDKQIMLHLPLEAYHNGDRYPDYYVITTTMSAAKIEKILDQTFKNIPLIEGVNNHMGSKATENKPLMKLIFRKLKQKGLFFVDSRTAPKHSVCEQLADEMDLPFAKRDVFLDNVNTREAIERQFVDVTTKAKKNGSVVAIGHDRKLTMQIIKEQIPRLQKQGFQIVDIKDLLSNND